MLLLFACATSDIDIPSACELPAPETEQVEVHVNERVTVRTRPLTDTWDTAVYVGPVRAEILELSREGCESCDECREENACTACEDCDTCTSDCASCDEWVRFLVPELDAGTWSVIVTNRYGQSSPLNLQIVAETDTSALLP